VKEAKEFKEKADRNGEKLIVLPQVSLPAPPSTTTWRVINDSILLVVSIENDFLLNLPDLHIRKNGLERLFDVRWPPGPCFSVRLSELINFVFFLQTNISTRVELLI
jgi:hypothetical protein